MQYFVMQTQISDYFCNIHVLTKQSDEEHEEKYTSTLDITKQQVMYMGLK